MTGTPFNIFIIFYRCSSTCQTETGYACVGASNSVCKEVCGDGFNLGTYACDDGNTVAGDG